MKTRQIIPCILLLLVLRPLSAQKMGIGASTGLSSLNYTLNKGEAIPQMGGGVEVNYFFRIAPTMYIMSGIAVDYYRGKTTFDKIEDQYEVTSQNERFIFNATYDNYNETQQSLYLNIPIMYTFIDKKNKFYTLAGVKLGIPLITHYNGNSDKIVTKGYIEYDGQWYENMPQHGFTSYTNQQTKGNTKLGFNLIAAFEIGTYLSFTPRTALQIGVKVDFGLLNVRTSTPQNLLEYGITAHKQNSLINAQYSYNKTRKPFVEKLNTFAAGIVVRYCFDL